MKIIFIIAVSLLLLIPVDSYGGSLSGRITDTDTKNLIADVNILIIETGQVVPSNNKGNFIIKNIPDGSYHLVASHISYTTSDTMQVIVQGTTSINISLQPNPWILNDVVVTGTRSPHLLKDAPVQTEIVSQRDFVRTGAKTVDEALSSSIGISINHDFNGEGAVIRGIEGDGVLILVDGERAVGRVNGSIDLTQFSLGNVEKIEIVKGTGSTLYGSEAMGGVINIITKKPKLVERSGKLYADYGSYASFNPSFFFETGNDDLGFNFSTKYHSTDGFDLDPLTLHTEGEDAVKRWNFTANTRKKLSSSWSLSNNLRFMHERRDWIEAEVKPPYVIPYDDDEENKRYEGSLKFDYLSGDKYSMFFRLFGTFYDHDWNKFSMVNGEWVDTSQTDDVFLEGSYGANYVIGQNHVLTYGLNYIYQDLESTELIASKEVNNSYAGYMQYEYQPIENINLIFGHRYEHHNVFGGHHNPSLNVKYQPNEKVKLRGFIGRGFRAPSIKEQYFVFDHSSAGYIVYGGYAVNPDDFPGFDFKDLSQETSINRSVSVEFSYGTIGLHRFTYFNNKLNNLIEFSILGITQSYWRGLYVYQNVESAVTRGIEWESRVQLNKAIDLSFSYNYLEAINLKTKDDLINRPKHTFNFYLTVFDVNSGLGGSLWGNYHSKKVWVPRTNTGGNEGDPDYAPQRSLLNVNFFKRFGEQYEVFVRGTNIFNQVKKEFGYWPGFELFVGCEIKLQL